MIAATGRPCARAAVVAAVVVAGMSLTGCVADGPGTGGGLGAAPSTQAEGFGGERGGASASAAPAAIAAAKPGMANAPELQAELDRVVARVEKEFGGQAGIAVFTDEGVTQAGIPGTQPAWSTIKVPIAMAGLRAGADDSLVEQALELSDNDAAYYLWAQAKSEPGSTEPKESTAVQAVNKVLREGHSTATFPRVPEGEDTMFGFATWTLKEQAQFGAHLTCVPEGQRVAAAMGDIVDWQRVGLNKLPLTRAKGGWGTSDEDQDYTMRQFGRSYLGDGAVGIAIIHVQTETGDDVGWDTGTQALEKLARGAHIGVDQAIKRGEVTPSKACPKLQYR